MSNLEVWASEYDAVVCYGKMDIARALIESDSGYDEGDEAMINDDVAEGQFSQITNDKRIKIMQDKSSDVLKKVPIMAVVPFDDTQWGLFDYIITLTVAQWIEVNGRGHLYSTEF